MFTLARDDGYLISTDPDHRDQPVSPLTGKDQPAAPALTVEP
ncbi:hypothetical protein [Micromonospora radicis]|nr:hypothetical protein [Micromonospora radicis]